MLNISLPSSAIAELEDYQWYDASGTSLKDIITSCYGIENDMIDRGDCESTTAPMGMGETVPTISGARYSQVSTVAHGGTNSWKFIKSTASGVASYMMFNDNANTNDMHGFVEGQSVSASVWVYIPSVASHVLGSQCLMVMRDYTSAWANSSIAFPNIYDTWQQIELARTIRAGATGFNFYLGAWDAAGTGQYFYIDDVSCAVNPEYTDISDYVTGISIRGSVNNLSGEPGANTATIELDNRDKRFSDLYTSGPYYGNLLPGKNVKVELGMTADIIDRGDCESATPPMVRPETVPVLSNATFDQISAASAVITMHSGNNAYKFTKTVAVGTSAYAMQVDADSTTDMHGFVAGQTVTFTEWVYIPTASGILGSETQLLIRDYQVGAWEVSSIAAANLYDQWQQVSLSRSLRSACTAVEVYNLAAAAAALNEYFYVDDITCEVNPYKVSIFQGKVGQQGFIETRQGSEGVAMIEVHDGADAFERKKFGKDYYYEDTWLVNVDSTASSLLHILLETHGSLASTDIVCNGSVSYLVPYTLFKEGESVQARIREIATGALAQYCGFRYDGKFVMESRLVSGWTCVSEYTLNADQLNVDVSKTLSPLLGNNVKVRGDRVEYIDQPTVLWDMLKVKPVGGNSYTPGWCWEAVNDGDTFLCGPSTASPVQEYWAEYEIAGAEILHVDSVALSQTIWENYTDNISTYNLTTTGTDLTTEARRAKLVLQNNTGQTIHVMNLQITGKPAVRYRLGLQSESDINKLKIDKGISDDDLNWGRVAVDTNASSILAYGQTDLVISSEYIVDDAQAVKILDWNLRYGKDPQHHFALQGLPFLAFMQPGAGTTLNLAEIGFAAASEVTQFNHRITPMGSQTTVELTESVPGTWVLSSAVAVKHIVRGPSGGTGQGEVGASRFGGNSTIIIGTTGENRACDLKCDGTADDVEMTIARDYLLSRFDGGIIDILEGIYYISSPISIWGSIEIRGHGVATNLKDKTTGQIFYIRPSANESVAIRNLSIYGKTSGSSVTIYNLGTGTITLENITIDDPPLWAIGVWAGADVVIRSCTIRSTNKWCDYAIRVGGGAAHIDNNIITGMHYAGSVYGISIEDNGSVVENNRIYDLLVSAVSTVEAFGIYVAATVTDTVIRNNRIEQVKHSCSLTDAYGIHIQATANRTMVTGNYCYNNGLATGIANTSSDHFSDNGTSTIISSNSWQ